MAEPNKKASRVINPRSRIVKVGNRVDGRTKPERRTVAVYPCPYCKKRMYADEVIDFGTSFVDDELQTGKFHRECKKAASS